MLEPRGKRGIFTTRFTAPDGCRISRSTGTANRREAEEFEAKLKSESWQGDERQPTARRLRFFRAPTLALGLGVRGLSFEPLTRLFLPDRSQAGDSGDLA